MLTADDLRAAPNFLLFSRSFIYFFTLRRKQGFSRHTECAPLKNGANVPHRGELKSSATSPVSGKDSR